MTDTPIESVVVHAVSRLVALRHGTAVRLVSLTYRIEHPLGMHETIELTGFPLRLWRPDDTPGDGTGASPVDLEARKEAGLRAAILTLLADAPRPMKGILIARRLNKDYESSYFRRTLASLKREGRLDHHKGQGYWPADRPLPEAPT
jgi:hypothetical protein